MTIHNGSGIAPGQNHPADLSSLADDRLVGVNAIAAFRGEKPRRTRYLIAKGILPVGREGDLFIASKRVLLDHHRQLTSGARSEA